MSIFDLNSLAGILSQTKGGTGVSNSGTITVGGNFEMAGAFTFTGTLVGNTSLTFPTSGTLISSPSSITNNRLLYSSLGSIAELAAQTPSLIPYYDANGLPTGSSLFAWDTVNNAVVIGGSGMPTLIRDMAISRNDNSVVGMIVGNTSSGTDAQMSMVMLQGVANRGGINRFNSGYTLVTNYVGTSIPKANTTQLFAGGTSDTGSQALIVNGTPVYAIVGSSATNSGFRMDAVGLKIDTINNLHTANVATAFLDLPAATASQPSVVIQPGSNPSSPPDGGLWHNLTERSLVSSLAGINQYISGTIFTQTASKTIVNTTTKTTLLGTGIGSRLLPANFWTPGKTIFIKASGFMGTAVTPNVTLNLEIGGVAIIATPTTGVSSTLTSPEYFEIELILTCRTTGVAGTIMAQGRFSYHDNTTGTNPLEMIEFGPMTTATVVNTTTSGTIEINFTWGTASASNSITSTNCFIQVIK